MGFLGLLRKNSPVILAGFAVAGTITTTVFAVRATPKATRIINELYNDHEEEIKAVEDAGGKYKLPKTEVIKAVLPTYLPTIGMGVVTIACIVGSTVLQHKRVAILEGLYSTANVALSTYQNKVVEQIGEKAEQKVRDAIAKDEVEAKPFTTSHVVFTGKGDTLFYDTWSGRYFKSDFEKVRAAVNETNTIVLSDMWATVNDFYFYVGLPPVKCGEGIGFNPDHKLDIIYSTMHADDMTPCTVLTFRELPRKDDF